eukprot:gene11497-biopygen11805
MQQAQADLHAKHAQERAALEATNMTHSVSLSPSCNATMALRADHGQVASREVNCAERPVCSPTDVTHRDELLNSPARDLQTLLGEDSPLSPRRVSTRGQPQIGVNGGGGAAISARVATKDIFSRGQVGGSARACPLVNSCGRRPVTPAAMTWQPAWPQVATLSLGVGFTLWHPHFSRQHLLAAWVVFELVRLMAIAFGNYVWHMSPSRAVCWLRWASCTSSYSLQARFFDCCELAFVVVSAIAWVLGLHHFRTGLWSLELSIRALTPRWCYDPLASACAKAHFVVAFSDTGVCAPISWRRPRFALRLRQLESAANWYRASRIVYMTLVLGLISHVSAGGSSRWMHVGWKMLFCMPPARSPASPVHISKNLRFAVLLLCALWLGCASSAGGFREGVAQCVDGREARVQPSWPDPDFTEANWDEMRAIVKRCSYCFANKPQDIKGYHGNAEHATFAIPFEDESKASYQRPRRYSPGEQEIIDIHCTELLEYGFIEPASKHCRHASNVVVTGKKDHLRDGPEELYQRVAKAKFKTTLDATKAFHQIPMATEEDRDKTAFWWGNQLYRYTSMPFGAAGATAEFIRVMDYALRALTHCTVAYVDDIVVYSNTAEQHLKDVEAVLRTLWDAGIRLHSGKSTFGSSTVDFLGFRIGHNTIGAQDAKCKAIQELPKPDDKTGLRSILGMINYYKGLVGEPGGPKYSEIARPLNDLLKKEMDDDGTECICVAISRSLGKTEKQYASFQGEMLAV